jgi:hypothetical protein
MLATGLPACAEQEMRGARAQSGAGGQWRGDENRAASDEGAQPGQVLLDTRLKLAAEEASVWGVRRRVGAAGLGCAQTCRQSWGV